MEMVRDYWMDEINEMCPEAKILLVGTMKDLR